MPAWIFSSRRMGTLAAAEMERVKQALRDLLEL
jgi:hypothetical protein